MSNVVDAEYEILTGQRTPCLGPGQCFEVAHFVPLWSVHFLPTWDRCFEVSDFDEHSNKPIGRVKSRQLVLELDCI